MTLSKIKIRLGNADIHFKEVILMSFLFSTSNLDNLATLFQATSAYCIGDSDSECA